MGATAGTGVRSFAEGGSTSSPAGFSLAKANEAHTKSLIDPGSFQGEPTTFGAGQMGMGMGGGGFGGINPAAIRADSRAFGIGPAAQSLQRDLAREQMQSQRQIYRPEYVDYGLGATPQARGYLGSIIGKDLPMTMYQNRMPTFTRPTMPSATSASYVIPYRTQSQIDAAAKARQLELERNAIMGGEDYKYWQESLIRRNPDQFGNQTPDFEAVMAYKASMDPGGGS